MKGTADKAEGAIKDTAGEFTGDKELQLYKAKGSAHYAAGDVEDAIRKARK